jgi:hypothetical protein
LVNHSCAVDFGALAKQGHAINNNAASTHDGNPEFIVCSSSSFLIGAIRSFRVYERSDVMHAGSTSSSNACFPFWHNTFCSDLMFVMTSTWIPSGFSNAMWTMSFN